MVWAYEDYTHLAKLLKDSAINEQTIKALLSNNLNTIIAALETAARYELDKSMAEAKTIGISNGKICFV